MGFPAGPRYFHAMPPDAIQPEAPPAAPAPAETKPAPARPAHEASRLHRLLAVGGTIFGLFIVYEVFTYFVAYRSALSLDKTI